MGGPPAETIQLPACLLEQDPERGWTVFMEEHAPVVYRVTRRVAVDEDEARDLAAEVLARLRAGWPENAARYTVDGPGPRSRFTTWLAVVVRNLAVDVLRSLHGRRALPRGVARMPAWQQELYRLLYRERLGLTGASESLSAGGAWSGDWEAFLEAAREVHEALPLSLIHI